MIRGPLFAEPRGRGWYIADAEMREVSCALYISKRAAVAAIRAMAAPAEVGHPLFYTVKKFGKASLCRATRSCGETDGHLQARPVPSPQKSGVVAPGERRAGAVEQLDDT